MSYYRFKLECIEVSCMPHDQEIMSLKNVTVSLLVAQRATVNHSQPPDDPQDERRAGVITLQKAQRSYKVHDIINIRDCL